MTPWKLARQLRYSAGILNRGVRYMWVVSFTHRPIYHFGVKPCTNLIGRWICLRAGMEDMEEWEISCPTEHQTITSSPNTHFFSYTSKTNSVALSPQVNYTDWATATCWRNIVPTFVDIGVSRGQRVGSTTVVNFSVLERSHYFSFK
jgi:hypothetical protein